MERNNPYIIYRRLYPTEDKCALDLSKQNIAMYIKKSNSLLLGIARESLCGMDINGIYELSCFLYDIFKSRNLFKNKIQLLLHEKDSFLKLIVNPIELWVWAYIKLNNFENIYNTNSINHIFMYQLSDLRKRFEKNMIRYIQNENIDIVIQNSKIIFKNKALYIIEKFVDTVIDCFKKYHIDKQILTELIVNKIERYEQLKVIKQVCETDIECDICMDNNIEFVLHPPSTHYICKTCLLHLPKKECPFCRKKFQIISHF